MDTKDACSVATAVLNRALAITHYPLVPELVMTNMIMPIHVETRLVMNYVVN